MFAKSFFRMLFLIMIISNFLQATEQKKIKVVVFDFSGVIAKTDKQEVVSFIAQSLHISERDALQALQERKGYIAQGKKEQDFWTAYANSKGMTLPDHWLERLAEAKGRALKEIPGMINLVEDLQKQGYQTALLSNAKESQAAIRRSLGYYRLFHPALFSYEIGARKPDPKAYQILLSRLQVPSQAVLFIDNQPQNVEAAKSLGMDGIVFTNSNQLSQELEKRDIKIAFPQHTSSNR